MSQVCIGMPVYGSYGDRLGTVERIEGRLIKVKHGDNDDDHFVPLGWVEEVDDAVHLGSLEGSLAFN